MELLNILNPQQRLAASHLEGPLLVIAGAGSGKTKVVTTRIAFLMHVGVPSHEIVAVTFTNKAAKEMRHRVYQLTGTDVLTCTFHSLCAKILRESIDKIGYDKNFVIYDEDDADKILKESVLSLGYEADKSVLKNIRYKISDFKNKGYSSSEREKEDPFVAKIFESYQTKLKQSQALDFDDLLYLSLELFQLHPDVLATFQSRFSFILIDEYQDTNPAQYRLIRSLAGLHGNVFAVGDPDQSIYSWRGANIENILNFEKDYPGAKTIALEQNYRSRNLILKAANALINNNVNRREKILWSERGEGEKIGFYICDNDRSESDFVVNRIRLHQKRDDLSLKDMAIFYRTNFQSRIFEDALLKHNIPYQMTGGVSFYQRREIKDILSYLRMSLGTNDILAFNRSVNCPKRGLGQSTLDKLSEAAYSYQMDLFVLCQNVLEGKVPLSLGSKALKGLKDYVDTLSLIKSKAEEGLSIADILTLLVEKIDYFAYLSQDQETFEERKSNIYELISKASEWEEDHENPSLVLFLEELTLKENVSGIEESHQAVQLMTLHHSKGLEFPVVFLVGMEEELCPHINSIGSKEEIEEERRLCYVGMTRAQDYLYLSAARQRLLWGHLRFMRPSRFLSEIPQEFLQPHHLKGLQPVPRTNPSQQMDFQVGDLVFHADFGKGKVIKVYTTHLGMGYDVYFFDHEQIRSLIAKFAKLEKVTEEF
ncbi:MAG: ATP-dependent helicase [Rhabdochlamydiaceae bacterium]